jgi:hypothetical protein
MVAKAGSEMEQRHVDAGRILPLKSGFIVFLGRAWYFLVYARFIGGNKKKRD